MPRAVAFFRNLNLGQGWAPTRPQLVGAFEAAGATDVDSIQVNGTVAFTARAPVAVGAAVLRRLDGLTGYADIVVVRPAAEVRRVAAVLTELAPPDDVAVEVTFYDARRPFPHALPWWSDDRRLEVVVADHRHAISVFRPDGRGGSPAGRVLQEVVGVKGTARGAATIQRVAARLG